MSDKIRTILLTNDDGVYASGINALFDALKHDYDVSIFAPDRDRSGASNSLTLQRPIRLDEIKPNIYSVQGTPTDCVHLALTGLLPIKPDLIISGVNAGSNLGDDVWYSGTVAGAMEGSFMECPAIAISLAANIPQHVDTAVKIVLELINLVSQATIPGEMLLNINIPDIPYNQIKGYEVTRLGTRHGAEPTIKSTDPRGRVIYWVGPPGKEQNSGPGTDFFAVSENKVSITPLKIDITDYTIQSKLNEWLQGI